MVLTAESFVDFNAEKAKLYVELAEQVKGINQMHLFELRLDTKSTIPMNWIELKSLRSTYLQLLLQVDVVKAFRKARGIALRSVQAEFVEGILKCL